VAAGRDLFQPGCSSCHGADGHGTANGPSLEHSGAAAADFYLTTGRMPLDDPKAQAVRKKPAYPPGQIRLLVAYVASLGDGPAIPTVGRGKLSAGYLQFSINCASCHSAIGAGGALGYGDEVPSLIHASATQIEEAARIGPGPMPVFGPDTLSQSQLDDVAKYVHYLQHPHDRGGFGLGHLGPIPEGFMGWVAGLGLLLVLTRLIGTRA
jgi:ubiquinol-cytochrome c reductase cytochrome c subunit